MARVRFAATWFSPQGRFRQGVQEVPAELLPILPKSAKVLDKAEVVDTAEEPAVTLRDMDELRAADNAFTQALEKAEAQYQANLEAKAEAQIKRGRGRPKKVVAP